MHLTTLALLLAAVAPSLAAGTLPLSLPTALYNQYLTPTSPHGRQRPQNPPFLRHDHGPLTSARLLPQILHFVRAPYLQRLRQDGAAWQRVVVELHEGVREWQGVDSKAGYHSERT